MNETKEGSQPSNTAPENETKQLSESKQIQDGIKNIDEKLKQLKASKKEETGEGQDTGVKNNAEEIKRLEDKKNLLQLQLKAIELEDRVNLLETKKDDKGKSSTLVGLGEKLTNIKDELISENRRDYGEIKREIEKIDKEIQRLEQLKEDEAEKARINRTLNRLEALAKQITGPRIVEALGRQNISLEAKQRIVNILKEEIERVEKINKIIRELREDSASWIHRPTGEERSRIRLLKKELKNANRAIEELRKKIKISETKSEAKPEAKPAELIDFLRSEGGKKFIEQLNNPQNQEACFNEFTKIDGKKISDDEKFQRKLAFVKTHLAKLIKGSGTPGETGTGTKTETKAPVAGVEATKAPAAKAEAEIEKTKEDIERKLEGKYEEITRFLIRQHEISKKEKENEEEKGGLGKLRKNIETSIGNLKIENQSTGGGEQKQETEKQKASRERVELFLILFETEIKATCNQFYLPEKRDQEIAKIQGKYNTLINEEPFDKDKKKNVSNLLTQIIEKVKKENQLAEGEKDLKRMKEDHKKQTTQEIARGLGLNPDDENALALAEGILGGNVDQGALGEITKNMKEKEKAKLEGKVRGGAEIMGGAGWFSGLLAILLAMIITEKAGKMK